MLEIAFSSHRLPTKFDKCRYFLGQGNLNLVSEKSGKIQGILLSIVCGNPESSTDPLRALSSNVFMYLKHILSRIGLNNMLYSGHSFRIGAASSGPGCSFKLSGHLRHLVRVGYRSSVFLFLYLNICFGYSKELSQ